MREAIDVSIALFALITAAGCADGTIDAANGDDAALADVFANLGVP